MNRELSWQQGFVSQKIGGIVQNTEAPGGFLPKLWASLKLDILLSCKLALLPMNNTPQTVKIEQGNTVAGVTAYVIESLRRLKPDLASLFDLPAGEGHFLKAARAYFPKAKLQGADAFAPSLPEVQDLILKIQANEWTPEASSLEAVTCISGVMCFDNLDVLFAKSATALKPGGLFVVTNDNVLTVRDRFSWFFGGHPKRFRLMYGNPERNWNLVLPQALYGFFDKHGFEKVEVRYLSARSEDYFFLPLALALYPFQFLYLMLYRKTKHSLREKLQLYPFKAMICRHYVLIGQKSKRLQVLTGSLLIDLLGFDFVTAANLVF